MYKKGYWVIIVKFNDNHSIYKFKCLLTKGPSETSSLGYTMITNETVSFFYYAYNSICVLTD